jgi:hypothetical protein
LAHQGAETESDALRAAFRVTSDDPTAVFDGWVDQLDRISLDRVEISAGSEPSLWRQAIDRTDRSGPEGKGWTRAAERSPRPSTRDLIRRPAILSAKFGELLQRWP